MKKLIFLLFTLLTLNSCDNIGEDERYIEVEPVASARKVLLEEFTGQRCTNCPEAHDILRKLEDQYGEDLIVVSIHAGSFGIAAPAGLMQPEGNEYAAKWGVKAYPCGIVDRQSGILNSDAWATAVRNEIGKISPVELEVSATLGVDDDIVISAKVLSGENLDAKLQLWVTEDDIVGFQIDGSERLNDYVHNNVFRACVNGLWGQDVSLTQNVYADFSDSINIASDWNINNLYIVAFIYDDKGVIQAAKCKISI